MGHSSEQWRQSYVWMCINACNSVLHVCLRVYAVSRSRMRGFNCHFVTSIVRTLQILSRIASETHMLIRYFYLRYKFTPFFLPFYSNYDTCTLKLTMCACNGFRVDRELYELLTLRVFLHEREQE